MPDYRLRSINGGELIANDDSVVEAGQDADRAASHAARCGVVERHLVPRRPVAGALMTSELACLLSERERLVGAGGKKCGAQQRQHV